MLKWRNKKLKDIPKDARKSLEVLDRILDEVEQENHLYQKHVHRRKSLDCLDMLEPKAIKNEDIRRSIEILDSVLAEFDDNVEAGTVYLTNGGHIQCDEETENGHQDEVLLRRRSTADLDCSSSSFSSSSARSSFDSYRPFTIDGSTSHSPSQWRKFTPPPVPIRSPGTRLSDKENHFRFSDDPVVLPSSEEKLNLIRSKSENAYQKVHKGLTYSSNSLIRENLDSAPSDDDVFDSDTKCSNCGDHLTMESNLHRVESVAKRRAEFESKSVSSAKKQDYSRKALNSDSGIESLLVTNSPFLRRKVTSCENVAQAGSLNRKNSVSDSNLNHIQESLNVTPSLKKQPKNKESAEDRILRLDAKFAKVKVLLKTNKILVLQQEPPSFVPSPPYDEVDVQLCNACEEYSNSGEATQVNLVPESKVTQVEDLPRIIPVDSLTMTRFGFDCAMEDDLSPGTKNILTSTPKNDRIHLSTFSQSVSSLGYVSSQSDLDLNSSFGDSEKVPIESLKSQTLPVGARLAPPLSYMSEMGSDYDSLSPPEKIPLQSRIDHFRSSSAPPLKHLQQQQLKKGLFGMSRKEKRNRHGDDVSMKSTESTDDGVYLKKRPIDGSTNQKGLKEFKESASPWEEKTKRKSVWKSILRKK